jgi:acyl carrier protein
MSRALSNGRTGGVISGQGILDFESFAVYVADGLRIDSAALTKDAHLIEDLGLDSFNMVNLILLVEELGVHLPDDVVVGFDTFGDVYSAYVDRASHLRPST